MKIGFTVDTNMLDSGSAKGTNLKSNLEYYIDYIKRLKEKDKDNELIFFLSEIVVSEILTHEENKLSEEYDKVKKLYKDLPYLFKEEIPDSNVDDYLKEEKKFADSLNILTVPTTTEGYAKVIKKALDRTPPFIKDEGDKGFKDCLIWESILNSEEVSKCDKFYFLTGDKDFLSDKEYLENEYKEYHDNSIPKIIKCNSSNKDKLYEGLNIIIDENKLYKPAVIKLYDENIILKYINELDDDIVSVKTSDHVLTNINIEYNEFNDKDISISKVVELDKEYKVYIDIHTSCYEEYLNKDLYGSLIMIFKSRGQGFTLLSYELESAMFMSEVISEYVYKLNNLANALKSIYNEPLKEFRKFNGVSETLKIVSDKLNSMYNYNDAYKIIEENVNKINSVALNMNKDNK